MAEVGYIKLYRQLLRHPVFCHETALKIWIWCLLKATHSQQSFPVTISKAKIIVTIKPGQFIFGRKSASEELKIPGSTVNRWLNRFEKEFQLIGRKVNSQYTIITICKWADYQIPNNLNGQAMTRQRTSSGQAADTYKNEENDKHVVAEDSSTHQAARNFLDNIQEDADLQKLGNPDGFMRPKNADALFKLISKKVIDDPDWWSGVKSWCRVEDLSRQHLDETIKKWASNTVANHTEIIGRWPAIDASLRSWLARERRPAMTEPKDFIATS